MCLLSKDSLKHMVKDMQREKVNAIETSEHNFIKQLKRNNSEKIACKASNSIF